MSDLPLLGVEKLRIAFGDAVAVDGLSFRIMPGERFALLGESGSGKSVSARSIAGLIPDGATVTGGIATGQPWAAPRCWAAMSVSCSRIRCPA
jgi:ABC-type glutathione transport system ATPase component